MKQLWLHTVRAYIRLGLFFYYKKIKVVNINSVPKKGAILFLANHQNALLDALLIATRSGRFSYFLTRASVFQNAIFSKLLKSLLMLPVYRIRDGWNTIPKNNAIFNCCSDLLHEQKAIVIFPEGSHNLNRTVRTLSKGFTRIIFETFEHYPETQLQLVPIGLNFAKAEAFADSVSLYFGNPIKVTNKVNVNKTKSVVDLKHKIFNTLCQLTTHVEPENYASTLQRLEDLKVDFLNPNAVNECIANDFKNCESSQSKNGSVIKSFFKFCLILALFVPYLIWKWGLEPKIKEVEFVSTFRFAVAISIVPIYLLIITLLLAFLISIKLALLCFIGVLLLTLLAVKL